MGGLLCFLLCAEKRTEAHEQLSNIRKRKSEQGAVDGLTVKDHGLVLLLSGALVSISPEDVPPLPAVEIELLVNKALERPRVSKRVRPLQGLRKNIDAKQKSVGLGASHCSYRVCFVAFFGPIRKILLSSAADHCYASRLLKDKADEENTT